MQQLDVLLQCNRLWCCGGVDAAAAAAGSSGCVCVCKRSSFYTYPMSSSSMLEGRSPSSTAATSVAACVTVLASSPCLCKENMSGRRVRRGECCNTKTDSVHVAHLQLHQQVPAFPSAQHYPHVTAENHCSCGRLHVRLQGPPALQWTQITLNRDLLLMIC